MMFQELAYKRLRARLTIDQLKLDDELIHQPSMLQEAAEVAADALRIRDAAKHALDIATAEATRRLRALTEDNGKPPSEQKVLSLVPLEAEVSDAVEALDDARRDVAYWQGLVDAFGEKGSALRRIAELTTSGYLTPSAAYQQNREELHKKRVQIRR